MSFASAWNTAHLPEKPWTAAAIVRLVLSVFAGIMMGGSVAMAFRYFETPHTSSPESLLAIVAAGIACYVAAMFFLMRPWPPPERHLTRLIGVLACVYGGIMFTWMESRFIVGNVELQNPILSMLIAELSFQGVAIVLIHFFVREHSTNWREGFGLNIRPAHASLIGICAGILVLYPAWELQDLSIRLFRSLAFHPQEQQAVEILRHTEGILGRVAAGLGTILMVPVGEELIFRGILYPAVKRSYGRQIALWSTALLFGAIHMNLASFLPLTFLAVVLILLYEYTGNLLAPIAVHCVFNAANFVELYRQQN